MVGGLKYDIERHRFYITQYGYDVREDFFWCNALGGTYGPSTYPYGIPDTQLVSQNFLHDKSDPEVALVAQ